MNTTPTNRRMLTAAACVGLGALALIYVWPAGSQPVRASSSMSPGPSARSGITTPTPQVAAPTDRAPMVDPTRTAVASSAASSAADDKRRLLEQARPRDVEAPSDLELEGPRPEHAVELRETQSPAELELAPQVKAEQARRLGDALANRADAVRERVEAARAEGDEHEATRQERILARLESRTVTLAQHAAIFDDEAQVHGDEGAPDEHEHEHEQ